MSESVPAFHPDESVEFRLSAEQHVVLSEAAALLGWTVPEFILCTALDRAERDLHAQAATATPTGEDTTHAPFTVFLTTNP
ncbi:DUF1778 domain-containing protein [Actinomadura rayongensis]|uniref:DUF1778 domain-containing protein n=1 Tax=Actinomadura rayongensis TaxID=1429076 RepID=A0A6I4W2G8_9ACTN|nr:DUF1778 domain-containing protein [Actinomadura rayongensis]MXQ63538.1 DUF1778 domain-containing protein [Actinomadura rayongensis]